MPPADELRVKARDEKTSGVVARGRHVTTGEGSFGPGEIVTADAAEIARLRRLGYLVTPGAILMPFGNGPKFFAEDEAAKGAKEPA